MTRKAFFQERKTGEIRKFDNIKQVSANLIANICGLGENQALVIDLPQGLVPQARYHRNSRTFMKHGLEVYIKRFDSAQEAIKAGKTPVQLREEAFDSIKGGNKAYCAYSFKPVSGLDFRTRKVSLVDCLEGAQIYAYSHQQNVPIDVKAYDGAKRVAREGADIVVAVPSREAKGDRYTFKFSSVPVLDNPDKFAIANSVSTDHACNDKRFNIRYKHFQDKASSRVFNFCAHEIAGYLEIMDHYVREGKSIIPLQMNPFALPTQLTVDFYKKLANNCLIKMGEDSKPRKLNDAEREVLLWGLVSRLGHDKTFYATEKLRDYGWKVSKSQAELDL